MAQDTALASAPEAQNDPYTAAVDSTLGQPPAGVPNAAGGPASTSDDPFAAAVDSALSGSAQQLRNSLQSAASTNPDAEAAHQRLAEITGMPLTTVRNLPAVAKTQAAQAQFPAEQIAAQYPQTASVLQQPDNMRMLHDDVSSLTGLEGAVRSLGQRAGKALAAVNPFLANVVSAMSGGGPVSDPATPLARNALQGLSYAGAQTNLALAHLAAVPFALTDIARSIISGHETNAATDVADQALVDPAQARSDAAAQQPGASFPSRLAFGAGSMLGYLPGMLLGGAGDAPAAADASTTALQAARDSLLHAGRAAALPATVAGVNETGDVYRRTGSMSSAAKAGVAQTLLSELQMSLPMAAPGSVGMRALSGALLGSSANEVQRQLLNLALPKEMQQPFDPEETLIQGILGAGLGAGLGPHGTHDVADYARQVRDAADATDTQAGLQNLSRTAAASKFRARAPEAFHQFVADLGDEHGVDNLYVDADKFVGALNQAGVPQADIAKLMPRVGEQFTEAGQTDGMLRIPLEDYATHIAGTPLDQALLPELKTSPDGMTFSQAQAFRQDQAQRMREVAQKLAQEPAGAERDAALQTVEQHFRDQLDQAGRFPAAANAAYAKLLAHMYGTLSDRLGTSPEELLRQYPLQVRAEDLPGATYDQTATVRAGKETLEKYGLDPNGRYTNREVAAALEARQREKYGRIDPEDRSDESAEKIANWMAEEVRFEMQHPRKSGVGWYSTKFQNALDRFGDVFPELQRGNRGGVDLPNGQRLNAKDARSLMTALIAITSDGQKVLPNFRQAADIYRNFRETGQFATDRGHQRQASIEANLRVLDSLQQRLGIKGMREYLLQEEPVSKLRKIAKAQGDDFKTEFQAHIKLPMAATVFGPKLGAFYANLMGAHGHLTMDRWWSRTFNRYRGGLLDAPTRAGLERFKQLLGRPDMSDDEALAATIEPRNAYAARGFKGGSEIEKAANTLHKAAFENLNDAPFNASDRTFMLKAVNRAKEMLDAEGKNISVADIQAVLWYYEKRLYGELGARQSADTSYEEAAKRVVQDFNDAAAAGRGDRPERSVVRGDGEPQGEAGSGAVSGDDAEHDAGAEIFGAGRGAGDRGGWSEGWRTAPLEGAPSVAGAHGPDPRLVDVAEQYAREHGIDLKRQDRYVKADPERGARIAAAYEAMEHAPNDPRVKAAYQDLIKQTLAQYDALAKAGYKFWFIDMRKPENAAYAASPWNAMRDLRANQQMGVFPTSDGFGTRDEHDASGSPMLEDTGLKWPVGGPDGPLAPVLANDLFRAVHDAFGHGLEGAGFRADGEENAWQAHSRLFTGSALGAITSETRGQNSWLNYGPHGEHNRTAKTEDTVFADQKTGLMPEWTWTEGRAGDMPEGGNDAIQSYQQARATDAGGPGGRGAVREAAGAGVREAAGAGQGAPLYQFAGERAETADLHALTTAKARLAAGEDAEKVRQETGWHVGEDGKWRFEISDHDAKFRPGALAKLKKGPLYLDQLLNHPKLFAAYPAVGDIEVKIDPSLRGSGSYNEVTGELVLAPAKADELKSTVLHEVQHAIQVEEGFARGGSPEGMRDRAESEVKAQLDEVFQRAKAEGLSFDEAARQLEQIDGVDARAFDLYRALSGEVESRNTQARAKLTDAERAATSPLATMDTPPEHHIVVFNGQEMASTPANARSERAPVARLSGDELHTEAHPQITRDNVVEAARNWFKANLQGETVEREGLGPVRISGKTWGKIKGGLTIDPEKARLLPAIPDIIAHGDYAGRSPIDKPRNDKIVAFHHFEAPVDVGGVVHQVGVSVGEEADGKLVYNLTKDPRDLLKKRKPRLLAPGLARGAGLKADGDVH